jgi:hypothetical protein
MAMNMKEIRDIAKDKGVKTARLTKVKMVQAIQQVEGNFDCFSSAFNGYCDQIDCLWKTDCFGSAKKLKQ